MKTRSEIIEETIAYYGEDPTRRSIRPDGKCAYYYEGCKCAVGRCMIDPTTVPNYSTFVLSHMFEPKKGLDHLLNPEYRGHSTEFWSDLQSLHDTHCNWDQSGLTEMGYKAYLFMLDKWA